MKAYVKNNHINISFNLIFLFVSATNIRYEITGGNVGGAFGVTNTTGAIFIAAPLDYETRKKVRRINIPEFPPAISSAFSQGAFPPDRGIQMAGEASLSCLLLP